MSGKSRRDIIRMTGVLAILVYLAWPAILALTDNNFVGDMSLLTLASFVLLMLIVAGYLLGLVVFIVGAFGALIYTASGDLPVEVVKKLRAAFSLHRKR